MGPEVIVEVCPDPAEPAQLAAWQRLWRRLLGPEYSNAPSGGEPEEACEHRAGGTAPKNGGIHGYPTTRRT
jgi:hypothetical protein